jgi:SAM-dependent methyltransferase
MSLNARTCVQAARHPWKWLARRKVVAPAHSQPTEPDLSRRDKLLGSLKLAKSVGAEIGPLHNALVSKSESHVIYIDHCDTEALRKKWSVDPKVDLTKLHVDAVWGEQTLQQAIAQYAQAHGNGAAAGGLDYVLASHVIEHVPDLVTWLQEIDAILKPEGELRLAIPDKRFTFDYLRRTSDLATVLYAYLCRARAPNALCLLDFCLNMANVDCAAAWQGKIEKSELKNNYTFESALSIADDARLTGDYKGIHCWTFTPASFARICAELAKHDLLKFECAQFFDTAFNEFEFFVTMRKSASREKNEESWKRMEAQAKEHHFSRVRDE